jgi:hypothetical protein
MENKYFTPDIEDMSVGCEFEMDDTWGGWKKLTLTKELLANSLVGLGSGNERSPWYHNIRVSYLTKEQIEAEGWEHVGGKLLSGDFQDYQKDNFSMRYATDTRKLSIMVRDPSFSNEHFQVTILKAECRDINTFRKIIKLLGI